MKNIDFLPNAYRERNAFRNARAWWGVVVLIFGTVILATASVQFTWRRSAERELASLQDDYFAATQRDLELARLQKQIQGASEAAALYTYLQHPWPRSQVLAAIAGPLPDSVHLYAIHVREELLPVVAPTGNSSGKRRTGGEAEGPKLSPEQQDLATLRQECDSRQTVVELDGMTDDVQMLHRYVAELGKSPLVAAANLKSLEAVSTDAEQIGSEEGTVPRLSGTRFRVHLAIKPGYGQPGGPEPKKNGRDKTTAGYAPRHRRTEAPL